MLQKAHKDKAAIPIWASEQTEDSYVQYAFKCANCLCENDFTGAHDYYDIWVYQTNLDRFPLRLDLHRAHLVNLEWRRNSRFGIYFSVEGGCCMVPRNQIESCDRLGSL